MTRIKLLLSSIMVLGFVSCKQEPPKKETSAEITMENNLLYNEQYRPQFHFSPPEKWMNDPNGLVYHQGVYHLFYQYYPDDIVWGPMHWGHAVSEDLIHWQHKPVALYPDDLGYIFSGSAVVDTDNTSGLGSGGKAPLVAVFTYHDPEKEPLGGNDHQTQGIAYSLDNGDTWEKYQGNPVLANDTFKDFRDPKVYWDEDSARWMMLLVAGDHLRIYSSPDLINWTYLSEFGRDRGAHGGVWECPDLFPLKVEGSDEEKWVLLISINPGGPNGGSATQYFVGDFDGTTFTSDQEDIRWVDWGADNYAGVTYNNTPDGDRIFIGWMSNWNYAQATPTTVWRSAMTLPRTLALQKVNGQYELKNYPVESFRSLLKPVEVKGKDVTGGVAYEYENFNAAEVRFETTLENREWRFYNEAGEELRILLDAGKKELLIDRSASGRVSFDPSFSETVHKALLPNLPDEHSFEVRIILDASSVEIFLNKGQYVMTEQLFPNQPYTHFFTSEKNPENPEIFEISRVW
ncbi:glycoside hydrolase family 32 protein [Robertkochia flava]|uniref:glycoside hydrolase family 32 protein n=1 Tax=Robertkochia flava TaxID=3447986 RepID=UPI001CCF2B42|nr:glycoside hydrolase family 32 protein [Robertkochia marina]